MTSHRHLELHLPPSETRGGEALPRLQRPGSAWPLVRSGSHQHDACPNRMRSPFLGRTARLCLLASNHETPSDSAVE